MSEQSLALSVLLLFSAGVAVAGISLLSFLFGRQLWIHLLIAYGDTRSKAFNTPLLLLCFAVGVITSHALAMLSRAGDYEGYAEQGFLRTRSSAVNIVAVGFFGCVIVDSFMSESNALNDFSYSELEMTTLDSNDRSGKSDDGVIGVEEGTSGTEHDFYSSNPNFDEEGFAEQRRYGTLRLLYIAVTALSLEEVFIGFSAVAPEVLQSRALGLFCWLISSLTLRKALIGFCIGSLMEFVTTSSKHDHPPQIITNFMLAYSLSTSLGLLILAMITIILVNGASDSTSTNFDATENAKFFGGAPRSVSPPLPLWVDYIGFFVTACSSGILLYVVANLTPIIFSFDSGKLRASLQDLYPSAKSVDSSSSVIDGDIDTENKCLCKARRRNALRIGATLFGYFILQLIEFWTS